MSKSCQLCLLEIWNETFVVDPDFENENRVSYYHFTCYLVFSDTGDQDGEEFDEELDDEYLDMIDYPPRKDELEYKDLKRQFPSAA